MRGGKGTGPSRFNKPCETMPQRPIIVFQGDADHTVHPSNASRLIAPFAAGAARKETEHAGEGAQRAYTRERITAPNGVEAEYWAIHGAPHAWSGGSQRGSFTDAKGPDASEAMMRFFLEHPRRGY
jgi:poly(3-hydroxybutyrate) depolymerase